MIKSVFYLFLNQVLQILHVYYKSRTWINGSGNAYDEFVIVPMIIWIAAFAENLGIGLVIPVFPMQSVGGIKMSFSANFYFHSPFDFCPCM